MPDAQNTESTSFCASGRCCGRCKAAAHLDLPSSDEYRSALFAMLKSFLEPATLPAETPLALGDFVQMIHALQVLQRGGPSLNWVEAELAARHSTLNDGSIGESRYTRPGTWLQDAPSTGSGSERLVSRLGICAPSAARR